MFTIYPAYRTTLEMLLVRLYDERLARVSQLRDYLHNISHEVFTQRAYGIDFWYAEIVHDEDFVMFKLKTSDFVLVPTNYAHDFIDKVLRHQL
jgi:hypothetical protein